MPSDQDRFEPDPSPEEFRRLGYRAIDLLAAYFDTLGDRRVYPETDPATIAAAFDEAVPGSTPKGLEPVPTHTPGIKIQTAL